MTYQLSTPDIVGVVALWTHVWVRVKNVKGFVVIKILPHDWKVQLLNENQWSVESAIAANCSKSCPFDFFEKLIELLPSLKYQQKQTGEEQRQDSCFKTNKTNL